MPMPPPTRIAPAAPGSSSRGREGVAERAVDPDPLARLELAEPLGAGADALDQEVEADAVRAGPGLGDREGARQEGAAAALLPVRSAGEHVELARRRPGPSPSSSEKTR